METYNNQYNSVVVEDGHPASFRNIDGSLKNIYADDGSLTDEGKDVMAARKALSQSLKERDQLTEENKKRKRNRKLIVQGVLAVVIMLFPLFFHISLVTAYKWSGLPKIYPKASPTFSNTFITPNTVKEIIERYNNASTIFEQQLIHNEPFVKLLLDEGIIGQKGDEKESQERQDAFNNPLEIIRNSNKETHQNSTESRNNEQTEYYNYYYYGEFIYTGQDWEPFNIKIVFGNTTIKFVASERMITYNIVGSPKVEYDQNKDSYYTKYNVYYSEDPEKHVIEIIRYKDETTIYYESESCNYATYKK